LCATNPPPSELHTLSLHDALPIFVNESDAPAFVTCALANEEVSLNVQSFSTRVSNSSTAPVTVTCTAVVGDELATASYIPKSITDRKSTRLNSSHVKISYAVFCLK